MKCESIHNEMRTKFRPEPRTLRAFKSSRVTDRLLDFGANGIVRRLETGRWRAQEASLDKFISERLWTTMELRMRVEAERDPSHEEVLIHAGRFSGRIKERLGSEGIIFGAHTQSLRIPREAEILDALASLAEDFVIWLETVGEEIEDSHFLVKVRRQDVVGRFKSLHHS